MAADMSDVFADSEKIKATDEELRSISFLVGKAVSLKEEIDAMQAQLDARTKEHRDILEKELPEAMDAAGSSSFTDKDTGKKVAIKDDVRASISKGNAPEAHAWLRNHGHEDLIKNEIIIPLNKGLDNVASEIVQEVKNRFGLDAERKEAVHAQTLGAFCREQLGMGVDLPAGLLGLFIRRVAVIK